MDGRVVGFEYGYRFWAAEKEIWDEMVSRNRFIDPRGKNVFVYEVRASFRVKRRNGEDETEVGSESFYAVFAERKGERDLNLQTSFRLQDYWMGDEEIEKFVREAFGFAMQQVAGPDFRVIPLVVGLDVCTVQREGEELEHAMDRAMRPEKLAPLCLWQLEYYWTAGVDLSFGHLLKERLPRIRVVEDVDNIKGVGLTMETCPICLHDPVIGDQITPLLPTCRHVFHSYCILTWLLNNNSCPLCRVQAYDYDSDSLD